MKKIHADNGVEYLISDLIPCTHAFATRNGGVSRLPETSSLNLAFGRGDTEDVVLRNLTLFGEAVEFNPRSVISLRQLHSPNVRIVTGQDAGLGYYRSCPDGADGYATVVNGITLGVKSADCVPILLCAVGADGQAYAAAAIHAGWRGTVARIAERGVEALLSLGAAPGDIRAAIGPAIGKCCFEIGSDVRDEIEQRLGCGVCERFVWPAEAELNGGVEESSGMYTETDAKIMEKENCAGTAVADAGLCFDELKPLKWRADLKAINTHLLISAGVRAENIDISDDCTCCLPELYFSHRRSGDARGTMLSVINLTPRRFPGN